MTFETLEQILAHKFHGVHPADTEAFAAIDNFIRRDDVPIEAKIEAIHYMSTEGMGANSKRPTAQEVIEIYFE